MSTSTRQLGRQGNNPTANSNTTSNRNSTGVAQTTTTTTRASATTPPRRYVLDVPKTRRTRSSRTTSATLDANNQDLDLINSTARNPGSITEYVTATSDDYYNRQQIYRSQSRDYITQDGYIQTRGNNQIQYADDATIKKLLESGVSYINSNNEDQEVQTLTSQGTTDIKNYPLNFDSNPDVVFRPNTQRITYKQDISVRYLKPSTPPPPGPIVIREIRTPAPPPAPPVILRQRPPPPRTPSPIIIREKPPPRPKSVPTTVVKKIIPPPPPPPRQIIIERMPKLPPKPRPVIIERWLPYQQQKRKIVHEKAKPLEPQAPIKNRIIEWRPPEVEIVKQVKKLGIQQLDPTNYYTKHGDQLYTTEFVQRKLTELGLQEELALMQEQQTAASREQITMEQTDEYNVRQILNDYAQGSSRQAYTATTTTTTTTGATNPIVRVVRSLSNSGIVDEYGEQKVFYDRSTPDLTNYVYERNSYSVDENRSDVPVLTEEMLLRARSNSGGKFPSHLLSKLGSQIYEIPPDQIDLTTSENRTNSTSRYYVFNQGETAYESQGEEIGAREEPYQEKYVQLTASDFNRLATNYELYSSTGQKLEGEQATF